VNIEISLFGIRDLIKKAIRPVLTLKLTNDPQKREIVVKLDQQVNTKNPNFGKIIQFENVDLPVEPLLWPQL
jgi:hypothetical protein